MDSYNIAKVTDSKNELRPYVSVVYIVAFLQTLMPLVLRTPVFSALGVFIAALGFAIGRMSILAAVVLVIFGVTNAVFLALQATIGSTVQSFVLVACGIRAIGIIRRGKSVNRQASTSLEHREQHPDTIVGERHFEDAKHKNGGALIRRVVVIVVGLVAVAVVIALGAPPQQGGLLGAAIIVVFWSWGRKSRPVRSEPAGSMVEKDGTTRTFAPVNNGQVAGGRPDSISHARAPCPFCAEDIKVAAILCRYCKSTLETGWANRHVMKDSTRDCAKVLEKVGRAKKAIVDVIQDRALEDASAEKASQPSVQGQACGENYPQTNEMESLGITFDGEFYHFKRYRYSKLSDAVNCAKLSTGGGMS